MDRGRYSIRSAAFLLQSEAGGLFRAAGSKGWSKGWERFLVCTDAAWMLLYRQRAVS